MKRQEKINTVVKMIKREAYEARMLDEIQCLGFDQDMIKFYRDMAIGKACGAMMALEAMTGKSFQGEYDQAVEEATQDIPGTGYDIVKLLNLAGFNGEEYYKITSTRTA
jgi:hypothetical protein